MENSAERNRLRRSNAIDRSSVFGMHAKEKQRWISKQFSSLKTELFKKLTATREAVEKISNEIKYSLGKISACEL